MTKAVNIIDCDCDGVNCCGGRGIAVFQVERDRKVMKVCTRCDLPTDKNKKILKYVKKLPANELINFDALGAMCLSFSLQNKEYPLI